MDDDTRSNRTLRALRLALVVLVVTGACGRSEPPSPALTSAGATTAAHPAPAPQGWEEGPAALDRALASGAPVLLYMSSEWCPPCRALEANLLSKQAFRDATRGLYRVRVDGDADGAQAIAERFEAQAYPTLLLLSPGGQELFRAHHAVSLEELGPALAAAAAAGS